MSPEEMAIAKRIEHEIGYVPLGTIDLLEVLSRPDILPLVEIYLANKKDKW